MLIKRTVKIKIANMNNAQEFTNIASAYEYDVDLRSGKYVVNGKSILGILSLDLTKPILVDIYGDNEEKLITRIQKFIAE
jgi:phosphocarrier protein HPr